MEVAKLELLAYRLYRVNPNEMVEEEGLVPSSWTTRDPLLVISTADVIVTVPLEIEQYKGVI
jgi:hypothetical protein